MFRISDLSALNFRTDWKGSTNEDLCYRQRFLPTDEIRVQFACDRSIVNDIIVYLHDNNGVTSTLPHDGVPATYDYSVRQFILQDLPAGQYSIEIYHYSIGTHISKFCIVDSFPGSVLFKVNNYRDDFDTVFDQPFYFRVEGIILPSEVSFEVSNEDFRDQYYELTQLSALPYEVHTLTVGLGQGVPNWVGRKLNMIFSCSEVQINDCMCVRSSSSKPERTILSTDNPLFIWKIDCEFFDNIVFEEPEPISEFEAYYDLYVAIKEYNGENTTFEAYYDEYAPIQEDVDSATVISAYWDEYTPIQDGGPYINVRPNSFTFDATGLPWQTFTIESNVRLTGTTGPAWIDQRISTQTEGRVSCLVNTGQRREGVFVIIGEQSARLEVSVVQNSSGTEFESYWDQYSVIEEYIPAETVISSYYDEYVPIQEEASTIGGSYYIDINGIRHDFSASDTPIANFCSSGLANTAITINGQSVIKNTIAELVFGIDYADVELISSSFVRYFIQLAKIDISALTALRQINGYFMADHLAIPLDIQIGSIDASAITLVGANHLINNRTDASNIIRADSLQLANAFKSISPNLSEWTVIVNN